MLVSARPSGAAGATAATTCACSWATARARSPAWCGRSSRRSRSSRARASRSGSAAATPCTRASDRRSTSAACAAAEPGSFEPGDLLDGPARDVEQMEAEVRELLATIQQPHLRDAARARVRRGLRAVGGLPRRAGRQVLPPGLPARAARALARRRPGGQRDQRHLPRASTATSRSPARCCTTSASSRPTRRAAAEHRPHRRSAGCTARSRSATTASAARSRTSTASPSISAQAVGHIILSHHGSLEHGSPVVPCTREATLVHMIDNLGGRLGSFDRLEKELAPGSAGRASTARSAPAPSSPRGGDADGGDPPRAESAREAA